MPMSAETRQRFEAEKAAYWAMREELVKKYRGKWLAVINGQVVAVGDKPGKVIEEAYQKMGSEVGFTVRVGYEDAVRRIRQVTSGRYDDDYDPPIPMVTAIVANLRRDRSIEVEFIVDTGSDGTALRSAVADELNLFGSLTNAKGLLWEQIWGTAWVAGVGGLPEERYLYAAVILLGNQAITIRADCRDDLDEDLLGRDVQNEFQLTLCAKRNVVRFEWAPDEIS